MSNKLFAFLILFCSLIGVESHAQQGFWPFGQYTNLGASSVSASSGTFGNLTSGSVVYASNSGQLKTDTNAQFGWNGSIGTGLVITRDDGSNLISLRRAVGFPTNWGFNLTSGRLTIVSSTGTPGISVNNIGVFVGSNAIASGVASAVLEVSGTISATDLSVTHSDAGAVLTMKRSNATTWNVSFNSGNFVLTSASNTPGMSINPNGMYVGLIPSANFASSGAMFEVSGTISGTTVSTSALNAFNVSLTNIALNSNTLLAGQVLYARSSGNGLIMDGGAGSQYDFVTDQTIFSSTDLPAGTTPSATVHVSGTLLGTGAVSFTNPSVAFTRIPAGAGLDYLCGNTTTSLTTFSATTCTVSKREYKRDIVPMRNALRLVLQLKPRNFYFKSEAYGPTRLMQYGLIVDEVEKVLPSLVGNESSSVDYAKLSAVNTGAIQELQDEINELRQHMGLPPKYVSFKERVKWLFTGK